MSRGPGPDGTAGADGCGGLERDLAERTDVLADVELVIPTIGRPSLIRLLEALADGEGPVPRRVVLVDDRPRPGGPLLVDPAPRRLADLLEVVSTRGRGPAGARNAGWRRCTAEWIAFLDDDVVPPEDWTASLATDLAGLGDDVAGSQGRIVVPLPPDRRPTDWERNVAGLERARWATADLAYRRRALHHVGGFDERFPRAYREDADLGLRIVRSGYRIVRGRRHVFHPVPPTDDAVSVRLQAGNADDPFMRALHGSGWRAAAGVPAGRRPWHLAIVGAGLTAILARGRRRRGLARVGALAWTALTADLARHRIVPGPRDAREVARMLWTSVVLPFAATWHWLRGHTSLRARLRRPGPTPHALVPSAVLFDRDGTLVHDVPYNGDPALVEPVEGARETLELLRRLGIRTGVVTNQSGVARGLLSTEQVGAVNARIETLLGPFDTWQVCHHGPEGGCACRKPEPGMVRRAAEQLGVSPEDCVVIGDTAADIGAATRAGARSILVPNAVTLLEEIAQAPEVEPDLAGAVARVITTAGLSTPDRETGPDGVGDRVSR